MATAVRGLLGRPMRSRLFGKRQPWTKYRAALVLVYPLKRISTRLEEAYWEACSIEEFRPTTRVWPLFCARLSDRLDLLCAIPMVWLGHRDEDWSIRRAAKASVCLLLGRVSHPGGDRQTIAWFCKFDTPRCHSEVGDYVQSWTDITVSDDGWSADLEDDYCGAYR